MKLSVAWTLTVLYRLKISVRPFLGSGLILASSMS